MKPGKIFVIPQKISFEENELPDGWEQVNLSQISEIIMGQSPPGSTYNTEGIGVPFFQGKTNFTEKSPTVRTWCTQPIKFAKSGDILISVRAPVGPTNVADQDCSIGRGLAAIRPKNGIPTEYVLYYLKLKEPELALCGTGTTFTAIKKEDLANLSIPLPPLAEQQRIVARVEALLTHINAAHDRLSRMPLIMKKFRHGVLAAACSGRLTEGWENHKYPSFSFDQIKQEHNKNVKRKFKESIQLELKNLPDLPDNWLWINFSLLINKIKRGPSLKCNQEGNGLRYITSGNLENGKLRLDYDQKFLSDFNDIEKCQLKPGDLILNCVNSLDRIGKSAIFEVNHGTAIVGFNNYGLELNQNFILPKYANIFCQSEFFKRQLFLLVKHAVNQVSFATDELDPIAVSLPPLAEQHEIVRRVGLLFEGADAFDQEVLAASRRCERLTQAVLGKAFSGKL